MFAMNMAIGGSGNSGTFIGRSYSPISSMIQDHIYNFENNLSWACVFSDD